jgi:hypothetical protein
MFYRHRHFLRSKGEQYIGEIIYSSLLRNFSRIVLVNPWLPVIQYGFSSAVPALKYIFVPLTVGFFKG